ncbi:MAG: hypothetical protein HYR56_24680 [Acidobacteria bacterium]|nr:hypothetical protein [Acidobacteriota bacterium]MBI3422698.1 hypothetical protein [Acidobacteriota bacterium]
MNFAEFQSTFDHDQLPNGLSPYLAALWHEAHGDWDAAHKIVQEIDTAEAAWVHAYLHRKEGDVGNARYWYRTANQPFPAGQPLGAEWAALVRQLL